MIQQAIAKLTDKSDLTREETAAVMDEIMSGLASDVLIAGFLIALRMKGETASEIAGCAEIMRAKATRVVSKRTGVLDTCGTGGDGTGTFNISTGAAIVAAGAGVPVAKHGNRAVSSRSGSADVLKELGVNLEISPEKAGEVLDSVGITFLFAPLLHQAMRFAIGIRRELALRTVFNILGPLTNPAGAQFQVLGVYAESLVPVLAEVLRQVGSRHALVVHGAGGLDEISTLGPTSVSELIGGEVKHWKLNPEDVGLRLASETDLKGGTAAENAEILRAILKGTKGARRDIVTLNAGAGIYAAGQATTLAEGVRLAEAAIDLGEARRLLDRWIEATRPVNA